MLGVKREGDGRLADSTRSNDREQSVQRQLINKFADDQGAADQTCQLEGEIVVASNWLKPHLRKFRAINR